MPILKQDVFSGKRDKGKKQIVYAKKGDNVKIISERGEVLIVEFKNERFPVHKSKII